MTNTDIDQFAALHGWAGAHSVRIGSDWSPRQYWRLEKDGKTALVMVSVDPYFRGHTLADFIKLNDVYRGAGLHVPHIYARDMDAHILLIEDFGHITIEHPDYERAGYETAVDALFELQRLPMDGLTRFEDAYIFQKLWLFDTSPEWKAAWETVWNALPPCPYAFAHMDYKAGNLHWLPHKAGFERLGILDYQTAQAAPFVYDIVNLLEDARRVLAPELKANLKARYKAALPVDWQSVFDDWYTVMSAQFHSMILGQMRHNGKGDAAMIKRLEDYLRVELNAPVLAPIRAFISL